MLGISLCIIVKNEERNLEACIKSVQALVDEIIIVDTGSEDDTKKIAAKYTEKIFDFPWGNDFSAARNYSINCAKNEFILIMDADEVIINGHKEELFSLAKKYPQKVGRPLFINEYKRQEQVYQEKERIGRFFSKKYYKFDGIIHEQIVPIEDICSQSYDLPVEIFHRGYNGDLEERKRKAKRNIELLLLAQKIDHDPYLVYQIGKSYFMIENYADSVIHFEEAMTYDLDISLNYVKDLVETYGYALLNTEQYKKAMQLLNLYNEFSISADFLFLIAHIYMNNGYYELAINEFLKAAEMKYCKIAGVNGYLSFYNVGIIYECMGNMDKAIFYYQKASGYEKAEKRIEQVLSVGNKMKK